MAYDLYIDVLFLMNFLMDTLLLWTLRKILKYRGSPLRLFSGGLVGALWACAAALCPGMPPAARAAGTYVIAGPAMAAAAFSRGGVKERVRQILGLYLLAVLFGGAGAFLCLHTPAGYWIAQLSRGNVREALPVFIFLLLMAGFGFSFKFILSLLEEKRGKFYQVTLCYRGNKKEVTALLDTGNRLSEPVSGKPVSVLSGEAARELCPRVAGVIYVPYRSVGRAHGLLAAVRMDFMEIRRDDFYLKVESPLVGLSKESLSAGGSFDLLLNEKLFE